MIRKFLRRDNEKKGILTLAQARKILKKNLSNCDAMFTIGQHYLCGIGVLQHTPTAYLWLEKAYGFGHAKSASLMALIQLSWHDEGIPGDIPGAHIPKKAAFSDIRDLAITGHLAGCPIGSSVVVKLSLRLPECPILSENLPDALIRAAEAGDVLSCALSVQKAIASKNNEDIKRYMELGGNASPQAHLMLAQYYQMRNPGAALLHLKKSADLNNPEAQYHLGLRRIVQKSYLVGESLLRRAALAGHATAAATLGDLYRGTEMYNPHESRTWYAHAIALGHEKSKEALASMN